MILETSSDPELLRKYFQESHAIGRMDDEELKETHEKIESQSKELTLIKEQYEAIKKSQY